MINILILFTAFVLDLIIGSLFGLGFSQTSSSITPNLVFIALILITYRQPSFFTFMSAIFIGLFMDSFNRDVIYLNTFIYFICTLIVKGWSMRINDTVLELIFIVLAVIFVKEIMLYLYYTIIVGMNVSFEFYILNHLVYTLLFNLIFIVIAVLIKKSSMEKEIYDQTIKQRRASIRNNY